MKKNKIVIIFVFAVFFASAQIFIPTANNAFVKEFTFNSQSIKNNQIRKIIFEIVDKKDYQIAVDKHLIEHYEFNNNGYLTRYYYTDIVKTIEKQITIPPVYKGRRKIRSGYTEFINQYVYDTIGYFYLYNAHNNMIMKRYHDGNSFYETRYYNYDSAFHLIKENRYRETNVGDNKTDFVLGNQVLISTDSMTWNVYSPAQTKLIYYNSEMRPYKEKIFLSKDSLLTETNENYIAASWIQQVHKFEYNEKKQLAKAVYKSNANNNFEYKYTYEYDTTGWLLTTKYYKNEVLQTETSYVNDYKANLVNSIVIRDYINQSIRIVKLKYAYFDTIQVKNEH